MSGHAIASRPPALIVEDIHKSFDAHEVLKGVSLSAAVGEAIAIIGSSGSGKSTFLRCINFLEIPDRGRIVLGGEELRIRTDRAGRLTGVDRRQIVRLRSQLGMVFQSFNLWAHMTVLQNIVEGPVQVLKRPKLAAREDAMALLEKVGLESKHDSYPAQLSRRPAAARGDRPGARHATEALAVRRTDLVARSRAGGRGAARHAGSRAGRPDDDRRDPRNGLPPGTYPTAPYFCTKGGSKRRVRRPSCSVRRNPNGCGNSCLARRDPGCKLTSGPNVSAGTRRPLRGGCAPGGRFDDHTDSITETHCHDTNNRSTFRDRPGRRGDTCGAGVGPATSGSRPKVPTLRSTARTPRANWSASTSTSPRRSALI